MPVLRPSSFTRRLVRRPPDIRSAMPRRLFCSGLAPDPTPAPQKTLGLGALPSRIFPQYLRDRKPGSTLLSLKWPSPPKNMLVVMKLFSEDALAAAVKFARYVHQDYAGTNVIVEGNVASQIQEQLDFPVYISDQSVPLGDKVDVVTTFGGDGTVLRAASLFKQHRSVPPILSFNMGTLGFLNQWDFFDYKKAWQQMYMSGSIAIVGEAAMPRPHIGDSGIIGSTGDKWLHVKGKCMGARRTSKILLRPRIKADLYDGAGTRISHKGADETPVSLRAVNEFSVHRGSHPQMAMIDIYLNGNLLTEATADGILVSTPTGSTAYSLSAGGPIVHPLVKTMLITAISPRSLSFRSLALPLQSKLSLRISPKNRLRELELSVDGKRCAGLAPGTQIEMEGEFVGQDGPHDDEWHGGVPCVMRGEDNPWEGGLNGLLKFNSPFGADLPGGEYGL
ncbi:NAD+ kinase [Ophiocordyceps camponoti-floridani]|uniref:NAD+ kinase n=1 Tax=Ophiocordyceps camponoti-floridani TaxID=2030778 RepID=A0A8H4Q7E4_9HYPO|nr:NAD+ kinase [Ophiocordyceps camponoti-floridani]